MDAPGLSDEVTAFLGCPTPPEWLAAAEQQIDVLLLDHANCEMKAASTALGFIYRYPQDRELVTRMSRLAREELRRVRVALGQGGLELLDLLLGDEGGRGRDLLAVADDEDLLAAQQRW